MSLFRAPEARKSIFWDLFYVTSWEISIWKITFFCHSALPTPTTVHSTSNVFKIHIPPISSHYHVHIHRNFCTNTHIHTTRIPSIGQFRMNRPHLFPFICCSIPLIFIFNQSKWLSKTIVRCFQTNWRLSVKNISTECTYVKDKNGILNTKCAKETGRYCQLQNQTPKLDFFSDTNQITNKFVESDTKNNQKTQQQKLIPNQNMCFLDIFVSICFVYC